MEKVKRIQVGSQTVGGDGKLFVMAGPCVIEDPERTLAIGKTMKAICEKLGLTYIFKASFDKANRSSYTSYRGPGLKEGLRILADIKKELQVPVVSDIHETCQAEAAAEVLDVIQIPAFLCRQTDLLEAAAATGKCVNVKKGQFLAPEDMKNVVAKIEHAGNENIMLTERGISLGYHNLVVDMRSFPIMRSFGYPVVFDATHSVQLPGGAGACVNGDAVRNRQASASSSATWHEPLPVPVSTASSWKYTITRQKPSATGRICSTYRRSKMSSAI